jgi:hypothetical protein
MGSFAKISQTMFCLVLKVEELSAPQVGYFAPAGTPRAVVMRLNQAINKALANIKGE